MVDRIAPRDMLTLFVSFGYALRLHFDRVQETRCERIRGIAYPAAMRDNFAGQTLYGRALGFCEKYDAPSFDPDYDTLPLAFFTPVVRRRMVAPRQSIYKGAATRETARNHLNHVLRSSIESH